MSSFDNQRAPNVSEFIANLNAIPSAEDLAAQPDYNFDADLAMFTNTTFFDFDLGQDADLQPQADLRFNDQTAQYGQQTVEPLATPDIAKANTHGRQLPPDPLLLHGLLPTGCSSGPGPAPAGALHGPQAPPPGHIHLLQRGLLHGGAAAWRSAPCGTHGLQGDSLLHQGPLHMLQGTSALAPGAPVPLLLRSCKCLQGCFSLLSLSL